MKKILLAIVTTLLVACGNNQETSQIGTIQKVALAECAGVIDNKEPFRVLISAYTIDNSYVLEHWYDDKYFINYVTPDRPKEFLGFYIKEYTLVIRNLSGISAFKTTTNQGVVVTGKCVKL